MYQIVIIAGGLGSRLGKLTQKTPKALIKIDKKPFIYYQLNQLSKQGFKKVVICVGYLGDKIKINQGLTKLSHEEQSLAGLNDCTEEEFKLFNELNSSFKLKLTTRLSLFGFRWMILFFY